MSEMNRKAAPARRPADDPVYHWQGFDIRLYAPSRTRWYRAAARSPELRLQLFAVGSTAASAAAHLERLITLCLEERGIEVRRPTPFEGDAEEEKKDRSDPWWDRILQEYPKPPNAGRQNECPVCAGRIRLSGRRDAKYCPFCDRWLERVCGDPACDFCAGRARRPSQERDLEATFWF